MITAGDRLDVIDVLHRWSHVADGADATAIADVVTEDAVLEIAPGRDGEVRCEGRVAIEAHLSREMAMREVQPRRHVRNTIFTEAEEGRVVTRSYYLLTGVAETGLAQAIAAGVYEDELVRTPGGWRIRRRTAYPDGAATTGLRG